MLRDKIVALLKQGLTPEKIAQCVAVGAALGVFPVMGSTTLLCTAAAVALRLNLPAVQAVNYAMLPVQIALLIPFMRLGETIYGATPLPLTTAQLLEMVNAGPWAATKDLWRSIIHAVTAWALLAPFAAAAIYMILVPILKRVIIAPEGQP